MMRYWQSFLLAILMTCVLTVRLAAQEPPPSPTPGATPTTPAVPAQASGIVGLVQMLAAACKACKAKCCACPLGQLLTNLTKPLNAFGGGLLCPPCCPPVSEADKKKPSNSPQGACAKITQDTLEAGDRVKAVRCLAYVDCHWWPEAEAALITALRTDKNECVRLAAAQTLLNGCCCTKKTIEALTVAISRSEKDGNPAENSERVIQTAHLALQLCLTRYTDQPTPPEKPEQPKNDKSTAANGAAVLLTGYYAEVADRSLPEVVGTARRAVDRPIPAPASVAPRTGQRSLAGIFWHNKPN